MSDNFYDIELAGVKRKLPLMEIAPGVRIAILNILGDTELVQVSAEQLARLLSGRTPEVIFAPEAKAIPLAHMLSVIMKLPYVILRKTHKPYMGKSIEAKTLSITTGTPQKLFLDEKDVKLLTGQRIALVDDVISTGSTLQAMRLIAEKAGANVVALAAIVTEGDRARWSDVFSLGHLQVFQD